MLFMKTGEENCVTFRRCWPSASQRDGERAVDGIRVRSVYKVSAGLLSQALCDQEVHRSASSGSRLFDRKSLRQSSRARGQSSPCVDETGGFARTNVRVEGLVAEEARIAAGYP